jgi:hypothetical protein
MNKLLVSYAQDFASFLIRSLSSDDLAAINSIILFGSASRGDASSKSDVDIFISSMKNMSSKINKIKEAFFDSELYRKNWKLMGIQNDLNVICGDLKDWPDLKISIISDGIALFQKYSDVSSSGESYVIFWWDKIKPDYKRVYISQKMYGWNLRKKSHEGLLSKLGGKKLGPNTIMVPLQNSTPIKELFKKHKIQFKSLYANALK